MITMPALCLDTCWNCTITADYILCPFAYSLVIEVVICRQQQPTTPGNNTNYVIIIISSHNCTIADVDGCRRAVVSVHKIKLARLERIDLYVNTKCLALITFETKCGTYVIPLFYILQYCIVDYLCRIV